MTDQYQGLGDKITVTAPTGGATEGAIYVGTDRCGVYLSTVTGSASVAVGLEGEFTVAKATGVATTVLDKVYSTSTGAATSTATGNTALGYATEVAATGATTVKVKLAGH